MYNSFAYVCLICVGGQVWYMTNEYTFSFHSFMMSIKPSFVLPHQRFAKCQVQTVLTNLSARGMSFTKFAIKDLIVGFKYRSFYPMLQNQS